MWLVYEIHIFLIISFFFMFFKAERYTTSYNLLSCIFICIPYFCKVGVYMSFFFLHIWIPCTLYCLLVQMMNNLCMTPNHSNCTGVLRQTAVREFQPNALMITFQWQKCNRNKISIIVWQRFFVFSKYLKSWKVQL